MRGSHGNNQAAYRRSARSAGLLRATTLGLGLLALPAHAGAELVRVDREHLAGAVGRAEAHARWVRSGRQGSDRRAVPRNSGGNGLHGVTLRQETMYELFPVLANHSTGGDRAAARTTTDAKKHPAAVDALAKLAPGVLDRAQRQLAYLLGDWGVEWRASPHDDGTPGDRLSGDARTAANWAGAGYVMRQMDQGRLADWVLRAVQEEARRQGLDATGDWASSAVHPNGELAWRVSDSVAQEVCLPPLGGLRGLSATPSAGGGVSRPALTLLLPDNAEVPAPSAPRRTSNGGLVIQGGNFVSGPGGYTTDDASHFRERD